MRFNEFYLHVIKRKNEIMKAKRIISKDDLNRWHELASVLHKRAETLKTQNLSSEARKIAEHIADDSDQLQHQIKDILE